MIATYKTRFFIDRFKAIEKIESVHFTDEMFKQGDLIYLKLNNFNYKTIPQSDLIRIDKN